MHRFLAPEIPDPGARLELSEAESHHANHVLRLTVGAEVVVFDGRERVARAEIRAVSRRVVEIEVKAFVSPCPENSVPITLAVSLPKGDRQRWMVEKLVELGGVRLQPLITERGVAQPTEAALNRLKRNVVEASKQCGRTVLMEISPPMTWPELAVSAAASDATRWFVHPACEAESPSLHAVDNPIIAAIGPEGGFTSVESELAAAQGWTKIHLGPRLLRIETAAVALAAFTMLSAAVLPAPTAGFPGSEA